MHSRVYETDAFPYRVEFAAAVISRRGNTTRNFDTCFEMHDGSSVAAALVRRTKANPNSKLAQNLYQYVTKDRAEAAYEKTKHLTHAELVKHAAEERERAAKGFAEFMEKVRAEQAAQLAAIEAAT